MTDRLVRPFHRRAFLRRAGATGLLALAPTIVPASALGRGGALPPSERIRVGFIGVRNQGTGNLKAMFRQQGAEVAAVCDVDRDVLAKARALVEEQTGTSCPAFHDYRELLDQPDLDAVLITTPDHWHALPTIHACQAGKDVYCEKPLSLTVAEGQAMVQAARKSERVVQTGSQQRSDSKFRLASELVRNGRLGKLHTITVGLPGVNFDGPPVPDTDPPPELDYDFWLGPAPERPYNPKQVHYNFRFFWPYSGGQMTNWGAHHLDIVQWALDRDESGPSKIEGTATYHPEGWYEVPRTSTIVYEYDDGVRVVCEQGQGTPNGVRFEGDRGTLFVARGKIESDPDTILKEPIQDHEVHLYESANHFANWLDCIRSRQRPICDVSVGHRSATVCHLGNIAARVGRPIEWDPEREVLLGDSEAAELLDPPYRKPWMLEV